MSNSVAEQFAEGVFTTGVLRCLGGCRVCGRECTYGLDVCTDVCASGRRSMVEVLIKCDNCKTRNGRKVGAGAMPGHKVYDADKCRKCGCEFAHIEEVLV